MAPLTTPFRRGLLLAVVLATLLLTHRIWLSALGERLVRCDQPAHADIAVVLAGDHFGLRILRAAELVRQGYTSLVLVSGPEGIYGYNEAELAIPFAIRSGYPASWFVAAPHYARSTREEANALAAELTKRGVRKCLLVTSDFHSRRSGRIFRSAIPSVEFLVVAARSRDFDAGTWWHTREGQKVFLVEWMKTAAGWFGV